VIALPPALWLLRQLRLRQTGIWLDDTQITICHPWSLRTQHIPRERIQGMMRWTAQGRLGLVYHIPRPQFEGADDPRPPITRVTSTAPLADPTATLTTIQDWLPGEPVLAETDVKARLQRRRFRRLALAIAVFLATPLLTMLGVQIVFALYGALYTALPN
jgi:hypothetical protein